MASLLTYCRSIISRFIYDPAEATSLKRDRSDDDFSSDDENPSMKRLKKLRKTSYPNVTKDIWNEKDSTNNVRYIPVQVESDHPSTSTPNEGSLKYANRLRNIPVKIRGATNGPSTPTRSQLLQHVKPIQALIDDDDDDEDDDNEVILVETKQRPQEKIYKAVAQNVESEDDIIFVKEISTPPPLYYVSSNKERRDDGLKYYKICKNLNDRATSNSPKTDYNKFKGPVGITKAYKKTTTPLPKWIHQKSTVSQSRNRFTTNGSSRSTLSQVFDLDEKRNYQQLIKRVADSMKPIAKPLDIVNLAEDSASFRLTKRTQRNALNEIKLFEQGINADTFNETSTEYDPITVASINSSDSDVEIVNSETSTSSSVKIDRINSLKDSFKDIAVTSNEWLSRLDSKYKKKNRDTQVKLVDARKESDIISKVIYEQKVAHLEYKLKHELSIPESLVEEPQPTVELPPLTAEQEKLVKRALGPGPSGQLLVEKFGLRIHRRDLQTLAGLNWLNDEVINFYMNLLLQRSEERKDLPKVYATNTFFYPKLMQSGQAGLRRWTRKVDIFAHDLMVVPVHLGVHWCVSLVDLRRRRVSFLDSMGGRNQPCLDALLQYLRDEHLDKKGRPLDDGWLTENLKDIPQQMNGSDCGVFACTFAEFSARGAPYTFTQSHMPYLRRKAALEILQGRLLL